MYQNNSDQTWSVQKNPSCKSHSANPIDLTSYVLLPDTNISIHILWGLKQQNTVFAIGKSILDCSSNTNIGELCLQYNGGSHMTAGTCQVENDQAAKVLADLIQQINQAG